jgi:hypothetical protein
MQQPRSQPHPVYEIFTAFTALLLTCTIVYLALWGIDFEWNIFENPVWLFTRPEAVDALNNFGEVALGILGVAITVVAIIVELAANRYTPRITDLFVRDPINVSVMGFFVVTSVLVIWVNMSLYGGTYPTMMVVIATIAMSSSLLLLLPYFAYVFDFLTPTRVVLRIQDRCIRNLNRLAEGRTRNSEEVRDELLTAVEQLGDIALNSIEKKDKAIGISTINALAEIATHHITIKDKLPKPWFDSEVLVQFDQDFVAFHPDIIRALTLRRTWVEMKILRQYQAVFAGSLNKMRDINHLVSIRTRKLTETASASNDEHGMRLSVRFLNTYMRAAINGRDVRSAYNLMNEYRLLGEAMIERGRVEEVVHIAEHMKFYGQLAFGANIAFILESAAYDLCGLLEFAYRNKAESHDALLEIFLDVDREPDDEEHAQEASLRGVRKAQIKLGTYYLAQGAMAQARRVHEDMSKENPTRMQSILEELEAVHDAEYWEVSDRGINFEWLSPERREQLPRFYSWFGEADAASPKSGQP